MATVNLDIGAARDCYGKITYMAHGKGYVMVRRPHSIPFVMTVKEWEALPKWTQDQP